MCPVYDVIVYVFSRHLFYESGGVYRIKGTAEIYEKGTYQRSAPGRECPPGAASPGPGRDWIPELNSMNPGAERDPGT